MTDDIIPLGQAKVSVVPPLHETVPFIPAQLSDHDEASGKSLSREWPADLPPHSFQMHLHWCELVHAWNINPFRRVRSTVTIDPVCQTQGITRLVFTSRNALNDFIEYYFLDDFVVETFGSEKLGDMSNSWHWLTLANKFSREDVNKFLDVYKSAISSLAVIHEERQRAIRNDNNKVGYVTVEHFAMREQNELNRIKSARSNLGAGFYGK